MSSRLLVLALTVALLGCHRPAPAPTVHWPPLPADGFVAGRAATAEDVRAGRAGFSMENGEALPVPVPQYAFHVSPSGDRRPGIIIQAEVGQGVPVYSMRTIPDGVLVYAMEREFVLLGTAMPSEPPLAAPRTSP